MYSADSVSYMIMEKISTIIITLNEEENIKECLESVKWTDEIIVIDSGSIDKTLKICKNFKPRIKLFHRKWNGYSQQKNFGIKKTEHQWILSLDADERITPELKNEIQNILSKPSDVIGYKIPRKNYYFGKWLKWGGNYPDYQLRLFHKNYGVFINTPVHESITVKGKIKRLREPLLHYTYRTLNDYFQRFIHYTDLERDILISKKIKINFLTIIYYLILLPFKKFLSRFIFKLGFLDGWYGWIAIKLNNFTKIVSFYKYLLWHRKR